MIAIISRRGARDFFRWWFEQLSDWVPSGLSHHVSPSDRLVMEVEHDHIRVYAAVGRERHDFGRMAPDEIEARRDTLNTFLASLPQRPTNIEVRLPAGRYLQREVELPLAAEETLREAIGFQLNRLTPFSADEVIYDCGISRRDTAAKRLHAWLCVTPAQPVNQALTLLGGAPEPASRTAKTPPAKNEPMVLRYTKAHSGSRRKLPWALIVLNIALLAGAVAIHLSNRRLELDTLETALTEARAQAGLASDLREAAERTRIEAMSIYERRNLTPLAVEVLEDMSMRLSDDTWLQRFEIRDAQVRIYGVGKSASPLIAQLEASPLFADVRFESSVTRDAASGGERFSIVARLTQEAETAPPAAPPAGADS